MNDIGTISILRNVLLYIAMVTWARITKSLKE